MAWAVVWISHFRLNLEGGIICLSKNSLISLICLLFAGIRNILIESEENQCPDCKEKDTSPETLIPNRFLRNAVNNFRNKTGYRGGGHRVKRNEREPVKSPAIGMNPDKTFVLSLILDVFSYLSDELSRDTCRNVTHSFVQHFSCILPLESVIFLFMFHSQIEWINEKEVDSFSLVIQSIRRDSGLSLLLIYLFIHLSIFFIFLWFSVLY